MKGDVARALLAAERAADSGRLRAEFRFEPDCAVFGGHFPGRPLVPGALEIEMVRCALEAVAGAQEITGIRRAKFVGEIRPGDLVVLEAAIAEKDPAERTVKAELRVGAELKASVAMTTRSDS
jgi:3-hydroxyacyl-[acyl-carrier-protein] dehydratase